MRIIVEVPDAKEELVLSLMTELGYPAYVEDGDLLAEVEKAHIEEILRRRQDPVLSKARPWAEVRKKYVGKGL
jgi:hypothetical protein